MSERGKKKLFSVLKNTATPAALEQVNNTTNRVFKPRHSQRSQVRVLLQSSYSVSFIARTLRCHRQTVISWNGRFVAGESIVDKPRSGRPARIPLEAKIRLTAFYCQHNPLPGCSRWSIRWVEKYLDNHPDIIQFPMSRSSIHRCLISHYLKPYRWKYFLHISDPYFFEKMEKIISLYLNPPKYLFCLDECTGLQVLERIAPALYAQGDKPELREFEYKRHGTVSVFSILQVSNGKVFTDCIEDHTTITIIQSLEKHIAMYDPSETLHYILDNYSSHSTEEFCQKIAKLSGVETPKLKTVIERKEWLESRGKRIVFHFLPFHGSWLNQIEIWFGILQQKALKDESFSSVTACAEAVLNFTDTYNIEFSHPFKWSYNGDGLHEKVVSRLTKWIESESTEFSFKFFAKQLHLIKNLINNYWNKVKKITWLNLHKCIVGKSKFCEDIIRKINADNFKDIKGSKDDSKAQVEEKINLKIKETKERLMVLFSELKNQLIEKLTVT